MLETAYYIDQNDTKILAYFKMIAYPKIAGFHYHHRKMQSGIIRKVMEGL